jgi:hypothetical protein
VNTFLKNAIEKIGGIGRVGAGEADLLVANLQIEAPRTRVPRVRLGAVKQDTDQLSKDFKQFRDVIGNRP